MQCLRLMHALSLRALSSMQAVHWQSTMTCCMTWSDELCRTSMIKSLDEQLQQVSGAHLLSAAAGALARARVPGRACWQGQLVVYRMLYQSVHQLPPAALLIKVPAAKTMTKLDMRLA